MRNAFHDDLARITDDLVGMTARAGVAIERATSALLSADITTAESVIDADKDLDAARGRLDADAMDLLARQQPVATDLRRVVTSLQIAADLERMGDLARHIAKITRRRYPEQALPEELHPLAQQLGAACVNIVGAAGRCLASHDPEAAQLLDSADDTIDDLHRELLGHLVDQEWQHGTEAAVDAALMGRYYERFGDHAVSVGQRVAYMVTGETDSPAGDAEDEDTEARKDWQR